MSVPLKDQPVELLEDKPVLIPSKDYFLTFMAAGEQTETYLNHCYTVLISVEQRFDCIIDGQVLSGLQIIVINQSVVCSWQATQTTLLVSIIKPYSVYGQHLKALLSGKAYSDNILMTADWLALLKVKLRGLPYDKAAPLIYTFLSSLCFTCPKPAIRPIDKRIEMCLVFIEQHLHLPIQLEDFQTLTNLSAHRIRHLFTEQTGMPFSQYLIWARIHQTLSVISSEKTSLKLVCRRFGFTDMPHFCRTFKRHVGLSPGKLIKNNPVWV